MITINPTPRIVGRLACVTVVDAALRYVRVYVPFAYSDEASIARTVALALDTRPHPLPREANSNG